MNKPSAGEPEVVIPESDPEAEELFQSTINRLSSGPVIKGTGFAEPCAAEQRE